MASLSDAQRTAIAKTRKIYTDLSTTLSQKQEASLKTSETVPPPWVFPSVFTAPKDRSNTVWDVIEASIKKYGKGDETYEVPAIEDVYVRWTAYGTGSYDLEQSGSTHSSMTRYSRNDSTILFFHGGGFYMSGPTQYQYATESLAELTGGRCICPRYRLAPQHPFPAPLLDGLVCYLSLVFPPPGSLHSPIPPSKIVLAGDSAGANITLALIQVIHAAESLKVSFHGSLVSIPMPSGVATLSGGLDATLALPSWTRNRGTDIFSEDWGVLAEDFPTCPLWPTNPPRALPFCETSTLCHPLVSPAAQSNWDWAPPMWFACGQEQFNDSVKSVVEVAASQGVQIVYEEHEDMPHDWPLWPVIAPWAPTNDWPQSRAVMLSWAKACSDLCIHGCLEPNACFIRTNGDHTRLDTGDLVGIPHEERVARMRAKQASWRIYTGPK